ncbi:DegT/DnrJ/EryC1/StrS family aminotransferase [Roseivirga sp. BDSF3-8]|uniref:DegT/DnrJ/EryC1/StrS family aminotransferase n=1 Tax=Roseivirga sp. BDSF3-8 TaxID=3241598 RepID=UPI0035321EC0
MDNTIANNPGWKSEEPVQVTKTYLPPQEEYQQFLNGIWNRAWVTNHGPLVTQLEEDLSAMLDVPYLKFLNNGTIALQIAIKALDLKGEVITSPFSYVATTSSLVWENCTPIFADIEPGTFTLDPQQVEKAITPRTTAIMATHVFGNPCDVEGLKQVAEKYNLSIIYDAAHAYGVRYKGESLFRYGHFSTLSCHATKLFHTIEGGAITTIDEELNHKMSYMRNFGHNGQEDFYGLGINGKNSEFHAAMGLCLLPKMKDLIHQRETIFKNYQKLLEKVAEKVSYQEIRTGTDYNYSYFPVVFESEEDLLRVQKQMNAANIFPRRYFYPCLSSLNYVQDTGRTPVSTGLSKRILCLPFHSQLDSDLQENISTLLLKAIQ